eukprot:4051360-Amphidinium_carterae.2
MKNASPAGSSVTAKDAQGHMSLLLSTFVGKQRCLDCHRQTGKVRGKFNFPYLRRQECRPLNKHFAHRKEPLAAELHPEVEPRQSDALSLAKSDTPSSLLNKMRPPEVPIAFNKLQAVYKSTLCHKVFPLFA